MLDLAAKVNANEPGCHLYKLCKDAEGGYTVMELYEDADAMAAHGTSEHFKAAGAGFKGLMGGLRKSCAWKLWVRSATGP